MSAEGNAPGVLTPEHPFIQSVVREIRRVYGDRLVSIAVLGSVARRTARPDSDVDLFLVVEGLPEGRRARIESFDPVERGLAPEIAALDDARFVAGLLDSFASRDCDFTDGP